MDFGPSKNELKKHADYFAEKFLLDAQEIAKTYGKKPESLKSLFNAARNAEFDNDNSFWLALISSGPSYMLLGPFGLAIPAVIYGGGSGISLIREKSKMKEIRKVLVDEIEKSKNKPADPPGFNP